MSKIGKRAILLLLALPIGFNVMAQETKKPTLEELIPGGESYLYAENLYGLQWWGDECIKPGVDTLYSIQPKTGKETMVITREQINKVLEENKAGKLSHLYSVRFPWTDKAQMLFTIAGKFIVYNFKNNQVVSTFKPKDGANNEDYCAASGNVAYTLPGRWLSGSSCTARARTPRSTARARNTVLPGGAPPKILYRS